MFLAGLGCVVTAVDGRRRTYKPQTLANEKASVLVAVCADLADYDINGAWMASFRSGVTCPNPLRSEVHRSSGGAQARRVFLGSVHPKQLAYKTGDRRMWRC